MNLTGITIFVGPNNSGKSLILREIETIASYETHLNDLKIVQDIEIEWPDVSAIDKAIENSKTDFSANISQNQVLLGRINPNTGRENIRIDISTLKYHLNAKNNKFWFCANFLKFGLIRLDGRSRFNLTNDQSGGDLEAPPQNILSKLFTDESARANVRALVKDAFGKFFYIDPTHLGQLRIKLSDTEIPCEEQSLNASARDCYRNATHIKDASDGVQAFTGIVSSILSGEFHTILIDEPEAFLHPPLARKLGVSLTTIAAKRNGALLASTHSPDFLMGCVQASSDVKVVRLEYNQGKSRARSIDSESLKHFLKKPLMRSANVVSGLFHDGVIVVESDNDRVFYSEIFNRIAETENGYPSILFVNAQNKQTIRDIIGPLRQFGVPAAAIVDIDIVKDGGRNWTDWLKAAGVPDALCSGLGQQRSAINSCLENSGNNMKTDGGLGLIGHSDRLAADLFFDGIEKFGVFTVRKGELESWLSELSVEGKKTDWTVSMLERLGSDPNDTNYIQPSTHDVWEFMRKVVNWIRNPDRAGLL